MWEAMPADDFVAMASDPNVLGDPLLMTQHFIGGSRWEKVSDTEVIGYHQLRVPHQRWTDETRTAVAVKGHAHSHNTHWYRKVEGVWKFAGLCPDIRWGEYDFDRVFESGRAAHGEEEMVEPKTETVHAVGVPTEAPFEAPIEAPVAAAQAPAIDDTQVAAPVSETALPSAASFEQAQQFIVEQPVIEQPVLQHQTYQSAPIFT